MNDRIPSPLRLATALVVCLAAANGFARAQQDPDPVARARELQDAYWRYDAAEADALSKVGIDELSWPQRLRYLHLLAARSFGEVVKAVGDEGLPDPTNPAHEVMPEGPTRDTVVELLTLLTGRDSPYRSRCTMVWQKGQTHSEEARYGGMYRDLSLTHLGCLEVIRLDEKGVGRTLAFVPFDDLCGVVFGRRARLMFAKLIYDDGRKPEIVQLPAEYGLRLPNSPAWSVTFVHRVELPGDDTTYAIGVGEHDLQVQGDNLSIFRIGTIHEFITALSPDDPRLDLKCRARGIDPVKMRASMAEDRRGRR